MKQGQGLQKQSCINIVFHTYVAMISYNVVVGDTLSKVLVRFVPVLGSSMGSVRFFVVFLVTLVGFTFFSLNSNKFTINDRCSF